MSLSMILSQLSGGMVRTVGIFALTLIFSLPLGLLISFGRMSRISVIRNIFKIYISIMRGTPLMLQLMVFYFGTLLPVSNEHWQAGVLPPLFYLFP